VLAAFAPYLGLWIPERFGVATAAQRSANLPAGVAAHLPPVSRSTFVLYGSFQTFKTCVLDAATSGAGMLIWMSSSSV
jgi:hypothetical protein